MTFTQDLNGDISAIRVGLLTCLIIGSSVIISALIGWFLKMPDAVLMAGCGSGLIGIAMGAKSWQAQAEYRPTNNATPKEE